MRAVTSSIIASALLIASCQKPTPDFIFVLQSADGNRTATFTGYQPRGITEGYALLSFRKGDEQSDEDAVIFQHIENGQIGWISVNTIAVVADRLKFNGLSSDYFPDGTVESRIRVVTCSWQDMDCSSVQERLQKTLEVRHVAHFPEGQS